MKNISFMEQLLYFFLDVLIVAASLNMTELFNKLVASYKKMNENVKMKYVDAQSYVTNYWREIKEKPGVDMKSDKKWHEGRGEGNGGVKNNLISNGKRFADDIYIYTH